MVIDKKYYINTGGDGVLDDTTEDDVRKLVADLKNASKLVIHLHGGLVSKSSALETAERLLPFYEEAGARPVFMVWESGLLETVRNNLREINKEKIFKILVKQVMKYAVGKLNDLVGGKASGQLALPNDITVAKEFKKREDGEEPFKNVKASKALQDLNDAERKKFEDSLAADPDFQKELQAIVNGAAPENEKKETSKGITVAHRKSSKTLMSPEVVDELVAENKEKEGKGVLAVVAAVAKAGKIFWRVIRRHCEGRDHGLYATVVEEIFREFYIANIGAAVWGFMKTDTADTFQNFGGQPTRGGWFFIQELGRLLKEGHKLEVSVVGHSCGCVYASNLLRHLDWARRNEAHPLPKDFKLKNLVFLAPACSFSQFDEVLSLHRQSPLFDHFRLFALKDELESGYWEAPLVYPRSLLYLVSGALEKDGEKSAYDLPLVGMERYFTAEGVYQEPEIKRLRQFLSETANRRAEVWSEEDRGAGLASDAIKHGGFDETDDRKKTIISVQHILQNGW
ncbi:MAG: hypothetical protein HZB37_11905 [Planctomycetes bacterium]|nr:hypothetical protein [Planctomycetota bacterium]